MFGGRKGRSISRNFHHDRDHNVIVSTGFQTKEHCELSVVDEPLLMVETDMISVESTKIN